MLPVGKKWNDVVLPSESIKEIKEKFNGKKLLIIDEFSMLS